MPDLVIGGIPVIALIIGLVEYIKSWGLDAKYAAGIAILLGVIAGLAVEAMNQFPAASPWIIAAVLGAATGMAATGLYKVGSRWIGQ